MAQKSNSIRKKALEYAKKREWDKALAEFTRLAEIENHNPNVFNELGDIQLKVGRKNEAFSSFHSAIDAYSQIGLFNNAVAVCKKIIRLNANDHVVYGKLASLRMQQGFQKEAVGYANTFLDKVASDPGVDPAAVKGAAMDLASHMGHAPDVLERIAEYMSHWKFPEAAETVLTSLVRAYDSQGQQDEAAAVREKMVAMGLQPPAVEASSPTPAAEPPSTAAAGPKPATDAAPAATANRGPAAPSKTPQAASAPGGLEFETAHAAAMNRSDPSEPAQTPNSPERTTAAATEEPPAAETASPDPAPGDAEAGAAETGDVPGADDAQLSEDFADPPSEDVETPGPDAEWASGVGTADAPSRDGAAPEDTVPVSDIVDQFNAEVKADVDVEDHRSHYDLGMAYLEMELLPEAIREFQFAARSSTYQVRCLEMIGMCFLKQNQPRLAIKQLEKGLSLVSDDDADSLGLRYNLGLAYEMMNEFDKARTCFEDVYVVDVTFRDVAEKFKKYSS